MSTHAQDRHQTAAQRLAGARGGEVVFAVIMLVVGGLYHALTGLAAVLRDQIYVSTPGYTYELDLTSWGWTHLVIGALAIGTAIAIARGAIWGRVAGLSLAILSLVANFLFLPHYPVWSVLIIGVDLAIIWSLSSRRPG